MKEIILEMLKEIKEDNKDQTKRLEKIEVFMARIDEGFNNHLTNHTEFDKSYDNFQTACKNRHEKLGDINRNWVMWLIPTAITIVNLIFIIYMSINK